ncbi:MAG: sigma-54-dependent transcriptional regulator [Nitrospirales bacterium]
MSAPTRVLIVDDDPDTLALLRELMAKEGHRVQSADSAQAALELLRQEPVDVVITDIQMPGMDGLALLGEVRQYAPETLVILLTAYGSLTTAVQGIKAGAFDYLTKPFLIEEIRLLVRRAFEHKRILKENQALREQLRERFPLDTLLGRSAAMIEVYKLIGRVAQTDTTVLIQGESGTGKELVARAIHSHSRRCARPFVAVDCGALTESLLETELFGHERGAFTGAVSTKKGLLEHAQGGTCFLDEIGDISSALQSKLLRVLQEREIRRVGGVEPIPVDVRIIAASNRDLAKLAAAGKFREDLYYRLNVVTVNLPPLRHRPEDIPLLAQHFVLKYGTDGNRQVTGVAPQALELLARYGWPGNVRELEHTIQRAIVISPHPLILPENLPEAIRSGPASAAATGQGWKTLDHVEREHILRVLEAHQGDVDKAATVLGIHRKTLLRKLRRYGRA